MNKEQNEFNLVKILNKYFPDTLLEILSECATEIMETVILSPQVEEENNLPKQATYSVEELLKVIDELQPDWGLCHTCINSESDGDYGEIQCCGVYDDLPEWTAEWGEMLGQDREHQCPCWKSWPLVYCDKHRQWYIMSFFGGCDDCIEEWGMSEDRKCRVCGCTDFNACVFDGVPCHWVEEDLCSACAEKEKE